jgi:hypothetical protein
MGSRSARRRSSGLPFLVRLVSVVAALLLLCVTGRASAAPSNQAVPMCGEHNESIAAPPIFRATDGGSIRATPCHTTDVFGAAQSAPGSPERIIVYECPERVLGVSALWIVEGESSRLAAFDERARLKRPGFVGSLFRPPRA